MQSRGCDTNSTWNTMPTAPNPEGLKFRRGQRQQFSSILAMPVCAERDTGCLLILSICTCGRHYDETSIGNVTSPQAVIFPVTYESTTGIVEPTSPSPIVVFTTIGLGVPILRARNSKPIYSSSRSLPLLWVATESANSLNICGDHPRHS